MYLIFVYDSPWLAAPLRDEQIWLWVERASWIAAIAGLVAVVLAIFQIRELIRRPAIRIGFPFDPGGPSRRLMGVTDAIDLAVHWDGANQLSEPIELSVVALNDISANVTATGINLEVRYPTWLEPIIPGDPMKPPGMDVWSKAKEAIELNPGGMFWIRARFRVPRGRDRIGVGVIASMRDARPIDRSLTVTILAT